MPIESLSSEEILHKQDVGIPLCVQPWALAGCAPRHPFRAPSAMKGAWCCLREEKCCGLGGRQTQGRLPPAPPEDIHVGLAGHGRHLGPMSLSSKMVQGWVNASLLLFSTVIGH